ncbi:MAG: amidase [Pseudomonadota bacterium]
MKISEYVRCDLLSLSHLLKQKQVSPVEVLEVTMDLIEKINPKINAVTTKIYDYAKAELENCDMQAPLAGVPFIIKDLGVLCENTITTNGSRFYKDFMAQYNSEVIARLKHAGLIILGKSNTPEFGLSATTESEFLGACHNPWDLTKTSGGSSGGAAAIVASGILPAAHASDGGGSIRIPASCCGVFGLKPNRARVPYGPDFGEGWSGLSATHNITRSVKDSALLLDCIAGPEIGDPYAAPVRSKETFLAALEKPLKPLKIAFSHDYLNSHVNIAPDCKNALLDAVKLCESLGHQVEEDAPKYEPELMVNVMKVIVCSNTRAFLEMRAAEINRAPAKEDLEKTTFLIFEGAKTYSSADYARAISIMHNQARKIAKFFQKYDIFMTPTLGQPPIELGQLQRGDSVDEYFEIQGNFSPFTSIWNQTGQPAMSVPLFWNQDDLPIGTQFVAPLGGEALLLQLAYQLEQARPWNSKYPNMVKAFLED